MYPSQIENIISIVHQRVLTQVKLKFKKKTNPNHYVQRVCPSDVYSTSEYRRTRVRIPRVQQFYVLLTSILKEKNPTYVNVVCLS